MARTGLGHTIKKKSQAHDFNSFKNKTIHNAIVPCSHGETVAAGSGPGPGHDVQGPCHAHDVP